MILEAEFRCVLQTRPSNENCAYVFTPLQPQLRMNTYYSALNDRVVEMTPHPPVLRWLKQLCSICAASKYKVAFECRNIPLLCLISVAFCPLSPRSVSMTFPTYITLNTIDFLLTPLYPRAGRIPKTAS